MKFVRRFSLLLMLSAPLLSHAEPLGEDEDFFEFLADFGSEDEWIDPMEVEAWSDRRLHKKPRSKLPAPDLNLDDEPVVNLSEDEQRSAEEDTYDED